MEMQLGHSSVSGLGRKATTLLKVETMMEVNIDVSLSALESQARRLNQISDKANKKLLDIEERVARLNIGLEFWYPEPILRDDCVGKLSKHDISEQLVQLLGFSRVNGKWCLALKPITVVKGFYEGDTSAPFQNQHSGGEVVPLLDVSRDLRIAALSVMPDFLLKLTEYVQSVNKTIEEASA